MNPEWCCAVAVDFEEKGGRNSVYTLYQMLTDEKPTFDEVRAGAHPVMWIRAIFRVEGCCEGNMNVGSVFVYK